ncbi:TPA: HI1506-related protein [Yersinia enterocolitica]|uniref:HI1506-related protein n=1 Tax=Yersinia TaxID=629 RepID=UPI0022653DF6|nr:MULTISPECIES: HI1506-related protein [Yersinia]MDR4896016.1 HI1506-related protein [Yersinia kristensenii]MDX6734711.1 HI1506-related protein [Yersinia kristensenii]
MSIQITAKRDGFRRCGMAHSDKTQTYADDHFSPSVLAELKAEPMLVVSHVTDGQSANTDQSEALGQIIELKGSVITLQARNWELENSLQQLSKDADALKSDNERANATIADQLQEIDALNAQIASLTPAPDAASKEPESTKPAKTTK